MMPSKWESARGPIRLGGLRASCVCVCTHNLCNHSTRGAGINLNMQLERAFYFLVISWESRNSFESLFKGWYKYNQAYLDRVHFTLLINETRFFSSHLIFWLWLLVNQALCAPLPLAPPGLQGIAAMIDEGLKRVFDSKLFLCCYLSGCALESGLVIELTLCSACS